MTTRAAPARGTITINGRRVAAALAQLGSFATTWMCVEAIGIAGMAGFLVALALEFVLLAGKSAILHGHSDTLGVMSLAIDTLLNAGGLWPYVLRLNRTPTWAMLAQALGLDASLRLLPALVIALAAGFLLAAAPHWLWRK